MAGPIPPRHDSVCQTRGHDCEEVDALHARVAELESSTAIQESNLQLCQSVGDSLRERVAEMESREHRIREAAFHPLFNSLESLSTVKTILTLE